jgi:hypothetical protein
MTSYAQLAEEHTKINYEYIAVGILAVMVFMLFTGYGAEFIVHLFAFAWPFYRTIAVLESGNKVEYADWLIYWGE